MTSPIFDPDVDARRKERAAEYGTWEASGPIDFGGARAFNEGDPVPMSTVKRMKLDELGLVRKQGGKAAAEAAENRAAAEGDTGPSAEELEAQSTRTRKSGGRG